MSTFASGRYALAECPRCGNEVAYRELRPDGYVKGLMVCNECWDRPHEQDRPRRAFSDAVALRHARPLMVQQDGYFRAWGLRLHSRTNSLSFEVT